MRSRDRVGGALGQRSLGAGVQVRDALEDRELSAERGGVGHDPHLMQAAGWAGGLRAQPTGRPALRQAAATVWAGAPVIPPAWPTPWHSDLAASPQRVMWSPPGGVGQAHRDAALAGRRLPGGQRDDQHHRQGGHHGHHAADQPPLARGERPAACNLLGVAGRKDHHRPPSLRAQDPPTMGRILYSSTPSRRRPCRSACPDRSGRHSPLRRCTGTRGCSCRSSRWSRRTASSCGCRGSCRR